MLYNICSEHFTNSYIATWGDGQGWNKGGKQNELDVMGWIKMNFQ